MRGRDVIYIVDEQAQRREQLHTILNFSGQIAKITNLESRETLIPDILLIGQPSLIKDIQLLLQKAEALYPNTPIVLVGSMIKAEMANTKLLLNLPFPFSYSQLLDVLHQCHSIRDVTTVSVEKIATSPMFKKMIGCSQSILFVNKLVEQVATTDASVLILGESGTGKEMVARNIHALSSRANMPFVAINCGAIPAELLESELFGHEKGAFTGATATRKGRFEMACGGTLFLDEIGDMPLPMQVKLLRVLQERCFQRVGANKEIAANVRIIAATHRNLSHAITAGTFREDLFYRLNVFPIELPPLRERAEDVPLLCNEFILQMEQIQRPLIHLMPEVIHALSLYHWPGNIRELANLLERLSILHPHEVITVDHLPIMIRGNFFKEDKDSTDSLNSPLVEDFKKTGLALKEYLRQAEIAHIMNALEATHWVVARAAKRLKMQRTTLVEKIRKYGLVRPKVET